MEDDVLGVPRKVVQMITIREEKFEIHVLYL